MRKVLTASVSAAMCLFAGSAWADSHAESDGPSVVPAETWTCNYHDGKGPDDLNKVVDAWNEWMDDRNQNDYFAAIVTPAYYGPDAFDVGWIGGWLNGNAMGSGTDLWINEGGEVNEQFNEVIECDTHAGWGSMQLREPPENDDEDDNTFVLSFSNCSFKEAAEGEDVFENFMAAQGQWNDYADEHGIIAGAWMMFQIYGQEEEAEYDFKYVTSEDDFTMVGANWQKFADGHWRKSEELFEDILDCDVSRVYAATVVRNIVTDD